MLDPWSWFLFYLCIGLLLGVVLYRSDLCIAGILRDVFLFSDLSRFRHLLLAVLLTALFFVLVAETGLHPIENMTGFKRVSLLGVFGGLIFGFGMVLAGGCVFSSLYKMAGGNLTYLLVFVGIICGSLVYAEIFYWTQLFEQRLAPGWDIRLWPWNNRLLGLALGAAIVVLLFAGTRTSPWIVKNYVTGYLQPWRAAIYLALFNLSAYLFSGQPMGISTAYAKLGAVFTQAIAPIHSSRLAYFNQSSLEIMIGDQLITGSGGPQWDLYAYTEGALLVGILFGAFMTALFLREFRVSGFPPLRQGIMVFFGGILLALGARMANGCNIKHLLGGLPLLSTQSVLFVAGMLVGISLGTKILPRLILR
jgi:uncharacterized membrane protein YedE/YeeE